MTREEKHEKFKKLAEKRVNVAMKQLRLIGNLANKSNYEYTPQDADKIHAALSRELKSMKAKFASNDFEQEPLFTL